MGDQPGSMHPVFAQPALEQSYPEPLPLRLFFSLAWGTLAIVAGAAVWGVTAYFSNSIHHLLAFLIGWIVAVAILLPLRPIRRLLSIPFLPAAVLGALLSLFLGTVLFSTLFEISQFEATIGDALVDSILHIGNFFVSPEINLSFALSGVGAMLGFFNSWPPGSPAGEER
jgi:hypothetical protein